MSLTTLDNRTIDTLRDLPDLIPVLREYYEDWNIRVFNREQYTCKNYLSPNRREFYKVLLISSGIGILTIGLYTFYVDKPTLFFIHPNDIVSWKNLADEHGGYYCLFKKDFISAHVPLKATIDKYGLFAQKEKSIIQLSAADVQVFTEYFVRMQQEELAANRYNEDAIVAYLNLLMIEASRLTNFPEPIEISGEYRHIHEFFELLEQEASHINYTSPIRIKTAKEFASQLAVHPNHLNALLKKHTGQNVSTHIKNRLLEESKVLLLQTDWSIQDIGYSIGFAEQPNFNLFFKKNTGITPTEFRKSYHH